MAKTVSDQVVERLHAWGVRRVFGYPGDGINGVMGALNRMSGQVEFVQARHEELAALMAVGHAKFNGDLNMVTWEQRGTEGDPKFEGSQSLAAFPAAEYAKLLGLRRVHVDQPQSVALAWEEALASDRPTVLQMITDPNVPPMPPRVTREQVKHYAKALLHGDPQAVEVVKATAREWWDGFRHRK